MLTGRQKDMTECSVVAVNPHTRVPPVCTDVDAGSHVIGVDSELGDISHPERPGNRETVPGGLLCHQPLACCLSFMPAEFGVVVWLRQHEGHDRVATSFVVEERAGHTLVDRIEREHNARPSEDKNKQPEPKPASSMKIEIDPERSRAPLHPPGVLPSFPEAPLTLRQCEVEPDERIDGPNQCHDS